MGEEIFDKFLVMKWDWINKTLNREEYLIFMTLLAKCRLKQHSYYVVNTDEPYADKVRQVILEGENAK